jgi:hypothetical protein
VEQANRALKGDVRRANYNALAAHATQSWQHVLRPETPAIDDKIRTLGSFAGAQLDDRARALHFIEKKAQRGARIEMRFVCIEQGRVEARSKARLQLLKLRGVQAAGPLRHALEPIE